MRTLASVSSELQLELGLDLELNTEDVAAAVAAHIDDSLTCSCCTQVLSDKVSLHLHQISQHSVSELSLALLAIRGLDVRSGLDITESQDLCCQENDSESTISAHSPFMCGFMDDFHNNGSLNMVGDGVSNPSDLDIKFNNNNINYPSSTPIPQFSSECAQDADCEAKAKGPLQPTAASSIDLRREPPASPVNRSVAWEIDRSSYDITSLANVNRKGKNRSKRFKSNNVKELSKFSGAALDEVIDLTFTSKRTPARSKPDNRVSKEPKCRDANNVGSEERKFCCDICGRRYKKKSHLLRHARMHSGIRPFPCTVCDKKFAVRSILKQHLRVHTGERPFNCPFCFQRFPQKSGLVTHMMLHTGKPYKCDSCSKSFVSNHKLVVHKRGHDEQSGRLPALGPHSCPTCATRFFTTSALWEHSKVHSSSVTSETSSLTTAKSSDNSINSKVSALAPVECSVPDHLTGTLEFSEDISPERGDGKKSHLDGAISKASFKTVNGSIHGRLTSMRIEANSHNSQEVTASQALLTLMDSNSKFQGNRNESVDSDGEFTEDELSCPDFEFCDSIDLKEECFDFEKEDCDDEPNCTEPGGDAQMVVS